MESKNGHEEQETCSIFHGDEICIGRILGREASISQSSHIFYRPPDGVPFKWETNPGTPIHPRQEDQIFPLSPSPMMQSSRLPLPNIHNQDDETRRSVLRGLSKVSKKKLIRDINKKVGSLLDWNRKKRQATSIFGDSNDTGFVASTKCSTSSSHSLSPFSSNSRVLDTSVIGAGLFCCDPLDVHAILDEGNTKIYYCSHHKTAFTVEEDNLFLSRILSGVSTSDQFSGPMESGQIPAGIPFRWEMQPGTAKNPPENEPIPPPSPPPAMQSLSLPLPKLIDDEEVKERSTWKRAQLWRIRKKRNENVKDGEFDASFGRSSSLSSFSSVAKMRKLGFVGSYFSCFSPWSRSDFVVFAKKKFKSLVMF